MRILLVGSGGRENALAWKIASSESFRSTGSKLFCAPGNPGIAGFAECISIGSDDIAGLYDFAVREKIDFTVVGPEIPLSLGIADKFRKNGLSIFGPDKSAAEIESSKLFAKNLMMSHNVPTASFRPFGRNEKVEAMEFISQSGLPLVFKADGLAAGKGVIIAKTESEAVDALNEMCSAETFGRASEKFVIEEFLDGEEVSVFCITDGDDFVLLPFSRDHKKIGEGETGRNTGGMGAVSPVRKFMNKDITGKITSSIILPVLNAMKQKGRKFSGCLYCGLIMCNNQPYVIEFNCRFGDPETQSVLPLISSDFLELLLASANSGMKNYELKVNELNSCCVVLASGGYPGQFSSGYEITGLETLKENCVVFHSGTGMKNGKLVSAGGRVLSVVGMSDRSLSDAVDAAYEGVENLNFHGMTYRKDIGKKILEEGN